MTRQVGPTCLRVLRASALLGCLAVLCLLAAAPPAALLGAANRAPREQASAVLAKLPLTFEANQGQTDPRVKFLSRGRGSTLFLTADEAVLSLSLPSELEHGDISPGGTLPDRTGAEPDGEARILGETVGGRRPGEAQATSRKPQATVLKMRLVGANRHAKVTGSEPMGCPVHYFLGNDPTKWHTDVPQYSRVKYEAVYPGVDLVYYGNQSQLEYDLVVAPGADPQQIELAYSGADDAELDVHGDLLLHSGEATVRQHRPFVYQEVDGQRQVVRASYVLAAAQGRQSTSVRFDLGTYDQRRPLVIDPVLAYSTYLGGGVDDHGVGIAVDGAGNAYVTGFTAATNFPTEGALQGDAGNDDAFVTKVDTNATGVASLLYSTYLGGSDTDVANGIAVDGSGNAYVTGKTFSTDFPIQNAVQGNHPEGDIFVAKLDTNATGAASLRYSTYLAGNLPVFGGGGSSSIAVDGSGNVYVTGSTLSSDLPTLGAFQGDQPGWDAFVTKLDTNATRGESLLYSTYLGGSGDDLGHGIAVDGSGNAHVTGRTYSTDFPTLGALQEDQPEVDAFVTKLDTNTTGPSSLLYSTYLGGSDTDLAGGIAVDGTGNAYVTGDTFSSDFPTLGALQGDQPGLDVFVTKLDTNASGTASLAYSTYLGGDSLDYGGAIAADGSGHAYVTGKTFSSNFPTQGALHEYGRGDDAFVTKLDTGAFGPGSLLYSTYLTGGSADSGNDIAVDELGNAYVTGVTYSPSFPLLGAFQGYGGGRDAFVAKIGPSFVTLGAATYSASETGGSVTLTVNRTGHASAPATVTYATSDGTALAGSDYTGTSGVLSFAAGETSQTIAVPVTDDSVLEGSETFNLTLGSPSGADLVSPSSASVTIADDVVKPAASSLTLAIASPTSIKAKWQDNCSNETRFELQWSTDGGATWSGVISVAPVPGTGGFAAYTATGLTSGATYRFRVRAASGGHRSGFRTSPGLLLASPAAPTGLSLTVLSTTRIRATWTDGSNNEASFRLERSTDGGATFPTVYSVAAVMGTGGTVGFTNSGLTADTSYTYRVKAVNSLGSSGYAGPQSATTQAAPAAPSGLSAVLASATSIKLSWTDHASNEQGFKLERSTDDGLTWPTVTTVSASAGAGGSRAATSTGLATGTTYTYRVRAYNDTTYSDYAGPVSILLDVPAAPSDLRAARATSTRITVTWTDNATTEQGFKLERSTDGGATWPTVITLAGAIAGSGGSKSYTNTGLTTGTTYTYRLRAYNAVGSSSPSETASATP
jgi:hypothetical protein